MVQLLEDLPEPGVHLVVGGVVLLGTVVAHDRDGAVVLELDRLTRHFSAP